MLSLFSTPSTTTPRPGLRWGTYPERSDAGRAAVTPRCPAVTGSALPHLERIRGLAGSWQHLDDAGFECRRVDACRQLVRDGLQAEALEAALAVAAEAARRTLGLQAHLGQLAAAWHMLNQRMVEMATGEGKSLATALAACAAGLAGMPVHVLTANDYLVQRDAATFAPLYARAGLTVSAVVAGMSDDERRLAYDQAIVLVTARELVFDYLRDRQRRRTGSDLQQRTDALLWGDGRAPVLRGLCLALIDEADSVLIDEAQMPLILSREQDDAPQRAFLWQAWQLAGPLEEGPHFECQTEQRRVHLTPAGEERVADLSASLGLAWRSRLHREHAVVTALAARLLYVRDRDYLVRDTGDGRGPRILIIDPVTGRPAEGRRWAHGLHALVAIKESCRPEPAMETLDQTTYQRFFRRYHRLGGSSGTLREVRGELRRVYGLSTVTVPPRRPSRRETLPARVFERHAHRWAAVVQRCAALAATGRPVLVATDSVGDSRALSRLLELAGIVHAVLDARQDADESAVIAEAGRAGRVTVATQMAGRGTDIALDADARAAGGLHVLNCQLNASRRLDRQLVGRAARQGEPGSSEHWISLETARCSADLPGRLVATGLQRLADASGRVPAWAARGIGWLQHTDERRQARHRALTLRIDARAEQGLAFASDL